MFSGFNKLAGRKFWGAEVMVQAVVKKKSVLKKKRAVRKKSATKIKKSTPISKLKKQSRQRTNSDSESLKGLIVEHFPDGIVVVDRKGIIRYLNSHAEDLLKGSSGSAIGQRFDLPLDIHRAQDVSVSGADHHKETVAEVRAMETKLGRDKVFIVSIRDVTARANLEAQLRSLSDVDPLTGLLNRRGFLEAAKRQLSLAQRQNWRMSLFFLDLDGLKWINDEFGHLEGDLALTEIASVLRKSVRSPDIIGRFAGDEFTILAFEGAENSDSVVKISGRLRENLKVHNSRKRAARKISFSIGVAGFDPAKSPSLENMITEADIKMYEEKRKKSRSR